MILAQWGIETGNGSKCFNFNFGNVKRIKGQHWTWLRNVWENLASVPQGATRSLQIRDQPPLFKVYFDPPHPQTHFRAFTSAAEGGAAFIDFLRTKYADAWEHVLKADSHAFVVALKAKHYFTAEVDDYARLHHERMEYFARGLDALAPIVFDLKTEAGIAAALALLNFHGELHGEGGAVWRFQQAQHIDVDGIVGPQTRGKIASCIRGL